MIIKLVRDVLENGVIKTTVRPGKKKAFAWWDGSVLDVSDSSGKKLIDRGDAVEFVPETVGDQS